jgi:hypothetical protein
MNKLVMPILLALCVGTAFAQSETATTTDPNSTTVVTATPEQKDAQKQADMFCLRETGTHLKQITTTKSHDRAVECATSSPGRTYSREDIERTGALTVAEALRRLDPAIH